MQCTRSNKTWKSTKATQGSPKIIWDPIVIGLQPLVENPTFLSNLPAKQSSGSKLNGVFNPQSGISTTIPSTSYGTSITDMYLIAAFKTTLIYEMIENTSLIKGTPRRLNVQKPTFGNRFFECKYDEESFLL
ncbi:hypothetical protein ACTXT7_007564 [Hymenolepis weldensis]